MRFGGRGQGFQPHRDGGPNDPVAIGQGIGSLLGDNIVGAIVGGVTGVAATLLIGLAAGLTLLFNPSLGAASSQRSPSPAAVVWWLPAAVA